MVSFDLASQVLGAVIGSGVQVSALVRHCEMVSPFSMQICVKLALNSKLIQQNQKICRVLVDLGRPKPATKIVY